VPGVRENGGQYSHAAIWTIMAFAAIGDNEKVWELFSMINPVNHGTTAELVKIYKTEPYVMAADVYAVAPHTGRGGWTWYTGSAGWMNSFILQSLLGINVKADKLELTPCIPAGWESFKINYRYKSTVYHILLIQRAATNKHISITLDGRKLNDTFVTLADDQVEHNIEMILHIVMPTDHLISSGQTH
jgi:cyclic beta-1,2-glucan synthetase